MASGFKSRISSNSNSTGRVQAAGSDNGDVAFKIYYAGAWCPHGPEARDMAIDIVHEVYPGVQVEWERTARVSNPTMTCHETTSGGGNEIATFPQRDMSDDYRGPGVDQLKAALLKHKEENA